MGGESLFDEDFRPESDEVEPGTKYHYIVETSPKYEELRKQWGYRTSSSFGEFQLSEIDRKLQKELPEYGSLSKEENALLEQELKGPAQHLKFRLEQRKLGGFEVKYRAHIVDQAIENCLADEDASKDIRAMMPDASVASIEKQLLDESLSVHVLHRILIFHREEFHRHIEKLNDAVPEAKDKFQQAVSVAIKRGELPQLDAEMIERRMTRVHVSHYDPLEHAGSEGGSHGEGHAIGIDGGTNVTQQEFTLFHELTHALSGTRLRVESIDDMGESLDFTKTGLSVDVDLSEGERRVLRWLNEAETERITILLRDLDLGTYDKERKEREKLVEAGISPELIAAAYFENLDPIDPEGSEKSFRELIAQINDKMGQEYLDEAEERFG